LDWLNYKIEFHNDGKPFQKIFWAFPPKRRAGFSLQSVIAGTSALLSTLLHKPAMPGFPFQSLTQLSNLTGIKNLLGFSCHSERSEESRVLNERFILVCHSERSEESWK
jgi:hypothetical protein